MHFLEWKFLYFDSNFTKIVLKGPIGNKWALAQVKASRLFSTKPLPEPMLTQCLRIIGIMEWHVQLLQFVTTCLQTYHQSNTSMMRWEWEKEKKNR